MLSWVGVVFITLPHIQQTFCLCSGTGASPPSVLDGMMTSSILSVSVRFMRHDCSIPPPRALQSSCAGTSPSPSGWLSLWFRDSFDFRQKEKQLELFSSVDEDWDDEASIFILLAFCWHASPPPLVWTGQVWPAVVVVVWGQSSQRLVVGGVDPDVESIVPGYGGLFLVWIWKRSSS